MLEFLCEDGGILSDVPQSVLDECVRRLNSGIPTSGPNVWDMAKRVDAGTGSTIATSLYNRFYRPTSNFAIHVGAASLLRHVRSDGRTAAKPSRIWGRRAPARIADACLGGLTAIMVDREGGSRRHTAKRFATYADRHHERAIPPVAAIVLDGLRGGIRLNQTRQTASAIARIREFHRYVQTGEDADQPATRAARIHAELQGFLTLLDPDVLPGCLDPFVDYLTEKIMIETQPSAVLG